MKFWVSIFLLITMVVSCDYFKAPKKPKAIARVGENYLFQDDIIDLVPKGTSKKDSIAIVKSFIDRWATQKLLFEAAQRNIGKDKVSEFNALIDQYKVDLYTKDYIEKAAKHLGTQGDGNHFLFIGISEKTGNTHIVTHHGSRGFGAAVYKKGMDTAEKYRKLLSRSRKSWS